MSRNARHDRTDVAADRFTYKWEIHNFRLLMHNPGEPLESPIFEMSEDEVQWRLKLYPRGDCDKNSHCVSIFLCLVSQGKAKLDIKVRCEIAISKSDTVLNKLDYQFHYQSLKSDGWDTFVIREALLDACSSDDSFTVWCVIERPLIIKTKQVDHVVCFNSESGKLVEDLRQLLKEPSQFNDFTIIVENKKFQVHKMMLAMRCPHFARMFSHNCKESQENEMHINDTEPEVIEAMLEYIYTDQVTNLLEVAGRLIAIAHRYELEALKTKCEEILCNTLTTETVCDVVECADLYGSQAFVSFVNECIIEHYQEVVASTCENIDDPVRFKKVMHLIAAKKSE